MSNLEILIVEDESIIAMEFESRLSELGHAVAAVASGEQAIDEVKKNPPDLIIMDIGLPGIDGIDAAEQIKKRIKDVDFIYITSYNDKYSKERAEATKPLGYFGKPFTDIGELEHLLERARDVKTNVRIG